MVLVGMGTDIGRKLVPAALSSSKMVFWTMVCAFSRLPAALNALNMFPASRCSMTGLTGAGAVGGMSPATTLLTTDPGSVGLKAGASRNEANCAERFSSAATMRSVSPWKPAGALGSAAFSTPAPLVVTVVLVPVGPVLVVAECPVLSVLVLGVDPVLVLGVEPVLVEGVLVDGVADAVMSVLGVLVLPVLVSVSVSLLVQVPAMASRAI